MNIKQKDAKIRVRAHQASVYYIFYKTKAHIQVQVQHALATNGFPHHLNLG